MADLNSRLAKIETDQGHIRKKVDDMHEAIIGNGNTEKGIISRLANLVGQMVAVWIVIGIGASAFTGLILVLVAYASKAH